MSELNQKYINITLAVGIALGMSACGGSDEPAPPPPVFVDPAEPEFEVSLFSQDSAIIDNSFFPLAAVYLICGLYWCFNTLGPALFG